MRLRRKECQSGDVHRAAEHGCSVHRPHPQEARKLPLRSSPGVVWRKAGPCISGLCIPRHGHPVGLMPTQEPRWEQRGVQVRRAGSGDGEAEQLCSGA